MVAVVTALAVAFGCSPSSSESDSITVAIARFESVGLVYVAQDQGMFADNGLQVTLREYDTGVAALEAVLAGEADVAAGTAEFPLVGQAFGGTPVSAIATIDRPEFIYLVGRKDREIEEPSDLKGKRVGSVAGSIAQFYLGRFLELHNMATEDVTFVDLRTPDEWRAAITNGDVDAVVLAQPEASVVGKSLADNATFLSVQASQPAYTLAICTNAWAANNQESASGFLAALSDAEAFVGENPAQARAILQEQLGLDSAYMDLVWTQNTFALSLDQSLILAMEDEARWMIRNKITTETAMPDLGAYVDVAPLNAVKPGVVSILR